MIWLVRFGFTSAAGKAANSLRCALLATHLQTASGIS
jgi:hypothetical protein